MATDRGPIEQREVTPEDIRAYGRRLKETFLIGRPHGENPAMVELTNYFINDSEDALENIKGSVLMGFHDRGM